MRRRTAHRTMLVVLPAALALGIGALALPPAASAAGAATIAVTPTGGVSGTHVTISGANWPGYDSVSVTLVQGAASTFMCTVVASSNGTVAPQACTVPTSIPKGAYTLTGTDGAVNATTAFTLKPGVSVLGFNNAPAQFVAAGQTLGLTGDGFASTSVIKATFNGVNAPLTPAASTNPAGQFSGSTFVVPTATTPGNYPVVVKDASGNSATVHLDVDAPALNVAPSPGVSGRQVAFTGTGFPSNDGLSILLVGCILRVRREWYICEQAG